ncbi:MAG: hypothetical protein KJO07_20640, partial [Deltaproteobacteria bacterium]|nr:hypothetical protein [Deltaproteobacteria bacterium]
MRKSQLVLALVSISAFAFAFACGDGENGDGCPELSFEHGDDGNANPLQASAGEVRAGRLTADDLPTTERGLEKWEAGDFVLANDRIAVVIEDA